MSHSQRLRLKDLRDAYRLIGQCREISEHATGGVSNREAAAAWRRRMCEGLCRLTGAQVGIAGGAPLPDDKHPPVPQPGRSTDIGWTDDKARRFYLTYLHNGDAANDETGRALARLGPRPLITRARRQLLDDEIWYRSFTFNGYRRQSEIDDHIASVAVLPGRPIFHGITLHRALNDRPFAPREVRLTHWFHHELRPMLGRTLVLAEPSPEQALSPRLQEVFECLLKGENEKQIARKLHISQHTVHEHVKRLHRRFGVQSRSELLARWVNR